MRDRTHTEFTYKDPKFLDRLVMFINSKNCELSASLLPDSDEFIRADNESSNSWRVFSSPIPEIDRVLRDREMAGDKKRALIMLPMCEKHGVVPFWSLNFDYSIYSGEPRMIYCGPRHPEVNSDFQVELMRRLRHPSAISEISNGKKWYHIRFNEANGEEQVDIVKRGISSYLGLGYRVVSMSAELEPSVRSGEYVDYKESKATMFANDGKIEIYGNVPGFDEKFSEDLEIFRQVPQLPAPKNLLENLIDDAEKGK